MCTTWRHCYDPYNHPHTRHACPCEFHWVYALWPTKIEQHFSVPHRWTTVACAPSLLHSSSFSRKRCTLEKIPSVVKTSNYIS
ncbi:hypothetical protein L9F63_018857, partial [Diploptera punctata]